MSRSWFTLVAVWGFALVTVGGCTAQVPTIESALTPGRIYDDSLLKRAVQIQVRNEFRRHRYPAQVNINVLDGRIFIIGTVGSDEHKTLITEIAQDFKHARSVHNELHVGDPLTSGEAIRDRRIVAQARFALMNDPRTRGKDVRVFAHKGSIYLVGLVARDVGLAAADVTKYVAGIQKVVILLDYLD